MLGIALLVGVCAALYVWRPQGPARQAARLEAPAAEPEAIEVTREMRLELQTGDFEGAELNREGVELARAGRWAEAVAKLRAAETVAPGNAMVRRNLHAVLLSWGSQELREGRARPAADRFVEALSYERSSDALTGLGLAQVRGQQWDEAIAALEESLERGARDPATLVALGEAYEATDERVRALEMMQRAAEAGLKSPALDARIERLGREVDAEWDFSEESSRNFQIRFDSGDDPRIAADVLRALEAAHDSVGRKFGYYPDRPVPVVLYAQQDFHHVTQSPDWAGAVFDGRLKFPVRGLTAGEDLDRVARHEYAHALVAQLAGGNVPAWLNEGLAMWAEEESLGDRRDWAEQTMAGQPVQALAALARPFATLPPENVQPAYAQAYLTVLFLLEQYDERRLPRLFEAMRRGGSLESAFAEVYPVDLARFEQAAADSLG